jgi:hypothetical protein
LLAVVRAFLFSVQGALLDCSLMLALCLSEYHGLAGARSFFRFSFASYAYEFGKCFHDTSCSILRTLFSRTFYFSNNFEKFINRVFSAMYTFFSRTEVLDAPASCGSFQICVSLSNFEVCDVCSGVGIWHVSRGSCQICVVPLISVVGI